MLGTLKQRCAAAICGLLATAALGAPVVALADEVATYEPDAAMLTKVIDAPAGTDASGDWYKFHFAGGGTVAEQDDALVSDGVEQDATTLKIDDVVPAIPDVTLNGVALTADNTLDNGQVSQTVVQKSIDDILTENNVTFPHAGVYTYEVTESASHTELTDGTYIFASQAKYTLRIRVSNTKTEDDSELENRELTIESVTIEQTQDDNGDPVTATKIDPEYPKATAGKITETADGKQPAPNQLAGDERGRSVSGFTFANEYIKGGSFMVKKLYDGDHSDRTKYATVELAVYSAAAANPDAQGACITYLIEGEGVDLTEGNQDNYGEHLKLNGVYDVPQTDHYMSVFNDDGWAYVKADLKEDSYIRITGEFGPYNPDFENDPANPNGRDKRLTLSTSGLLTGQDYYVIERHPGDYEPTGYVHVGDGGATADPRQDATGMTTKAKLDAEATDATYDGAVQPEQTVGVGALYLTGSATGAETTVFVVNTIDETKVSPTGILIDNLPYILMVGVPLAAFAVMFVSRRRRALAA